MKSETRQKQSYGHGGEYYNTDGTSARIPKALNNQWLKKNSYTRRVPAAGYNAGAAYAVPRRVSDRPAAGQSSESRQDYSDRPKSAPRRSDILSRVFRAGVGVMIMLVVIGVCYSVMISVTQRIHREVDATQRSIRLCEKKIAALNADLNEANSRKTVMQFAAGLGMTNTNPYEVRIEKSGEPQKTSVQNASAATGAANGDR